MTSRTKKDAPAKPRLPLPRKPGHAHTTPKGKKGYSREQAKQDEADAIHDETNHHRETTDDA